MAGEIRFNTAQAAAASSKIEKSGKMMAQEINQLSVEIKRASQWWKGEASDAFDAQFVKVRPALEDMTKLVADISKQLDAVSKAKTDFERRAAAMFK
jgi:WXG100 family type VII secretion target